MSEPAIRASKAEGPAASGPRRNDIGEEGKGHCKPFGKAQQAPQMSKADLAK